MANKRLVTSLLVLPALASLAYPQAVQTGGAAPYQPRRVITPPTSLFAATSSADVYLDAEPTAFLGFGYRFDIDTNTWIRMQPIAQLQIQNTPTYLTERVVVRDFISQSDSYSRNAATADISATIGLFEAGANFEFSQAASSTSAYSSFSLSLNREYDYLVANLFDQLTLTPNAQAVLQEINDGERPPTDWTALFGEYIAVGTLPVSSADLRLNFSTEASWSSRNSYFGVRGSYLSSSGSASFSNFAEESILTENLEIDFTATGVDLSMFPLPQREDFENDNNVFDEWVNDIRAAMVVQDGELIVPANKGLLLMPMSAYPFAPLGIIQPTYDVGLLAAYGEEVRASLDALVVANRWRAPVRLRDFINRLGQNRNLADEVDIKRETLIVALDVFAAEAKAYAADSSIGLDLLISAASATQDARIDLETKLNEVLDAIAVIQEQPTYDASPPGLGWVDIGNDGNQANRIKVDFWVRDLAIFPNSPLLSSYEDALRPLLRLGEVNEGVCAGPDFEQFVDESRIQVFDVVEYAVLPTGLTDVRLRAQFLAPDEGVNVCQGQVSVQDELFRVLFQDSIPIGLP